MGILSRLCLCDDNKPDSAGKTSSLGTVPQSTLKATCRCCAGHTLGHIILCQTATMGTPACEGSRMHTIVINWRDSMVLGFQVMMNDSGFDQPVSYDEGRELCKTR